MITTSVVAHVMTTKILPALTSGTYQPIDMSAEQAVLALWEQQITPNLVAWTDLLDAQGAPVGPFAELQTMAPLVYGAFQQYTQAVASLPNLQ